MCMISSQRYRRQPLAHGRGSVTGWWFGERSSTLVRRLCQQSLDNPINIAVLPLALRMLGVVPAAPFVKFTTWMHVPDDACLIDYEGNRSPTAPFKIGPPPAERR